MNRNDQKKYFKRIHGFIPSSLLVPFKFELKDYNEPSVPSENNEETDMLRKDTKNEFGDEMDIDSITRKIDKIHI